MKAIKTLLALGLVALISACSNAEMASRDAPFEGERKTRDGAIVKTFATQEDLDQKEQQAQKVSLDMIPMTVEDISVVVPRTLVVSEKHLYLPAADIVWREDPMGNRHAQVRQIFEDGLSAGTKEMNGATPVSLYVQVMRFHALTEKARFTVGGVHSIKFGLAVRDLNTGQLLGEPRIIEADLEAYGGRQAMRAVQRGQTQKVRIMAHLAEVIRQELSEPGGFQNPQLGLIQVMNKF